MNNVISLFVISNYNNVYQCLFLAAFYECFSSQKPIRVQRYELYLKWTSFWGFEDKI